MFPLKCFALSLISFLLISCSHSAPKASPSAQEPLRDKNTLELKQPSEPLYIEKTCQKQLKLGKKKLCFTQASTLADRKEKFPILFFGSPIDKTALLNLKDPLAGWNWLQTKLSPDHKLALAFLEYSQEGPGPDQPLLVSEKESDADLLGEKWKLIRLPKPHFSSTLKGVTFNANHVTRIEFVTDMAEKTDCALTVESWDKEKLKAITSQSFECSQGL